MTEEDRATLYRLAVANIIHWLLDNPGKSVGIFSFDVTFSRHGPGAVVVSLGFRTADDKLIEDIVETQGVPPPVPGATSVAEYGWSGRVRNAFKAAGIVDMEQLRSMSDKDLLRIPNFGKTCLREVRQVLSEYAMDWNAGRFLAQRN